MRQSHGLTILLTLIFLAATSLLGCASSPISQPGPRDEHVQLFSDIRAVVVGQDGNAVEKVTEDLQQAGFTVEGALLYPFLDAHQFRPAGHIETHAHVFEADVLVTVDVGGLQNYPTVIVQGVDLQTGELLWSKDAVQVQKVTGEYARAVTELARRALFDGLNQSGNVSSSVISYQPERPLTQR